MPLPKISIIIPCYNVGNTITETLDSVLVQTYPNIEVITVDDGSIDNTHEILEQFAAKYPHINVYAQENKGLPATRNVGFVHSTGEFLVFLDGDDKLDPLYIEACYTKFSQNTELDLVYTKTEFFEARTGIFDLPDYSYRQLLIGNCIPATAMIRANNFRKVGLYDASLRITEDWELWIKYLYEYPNVYQIKKPLFFYRKRLSKDSMTDLNAENNNKLGESTRLYIYHKHYNIYNEYGYGLEKLFVFFENENKYRKKYYNVWYRKLFYKLFNKKKLE
ncbi:glycosyltransferase [Sphingobacterium sp. SGG-5]|uniref:glycosyltransferase family 2 protein n=1 Tax=Sphingobacterium sp. SGG-5 TaxID=2710881 RepID=UPI0013EBAE23|nr:glycosyltransferase [Sphingobacterium sp. SGG-5]NGM63272.1 glycosyltransferase [Sphingobacterium sp. SGG-5]